MKKIKAELKSYLKKNSYPKMPKDVKVQLSNIRNLNRAINREEMIYVVQCCEQYGVNQMPSFKTSSYNYYKSLLEGKKESQVDEDRIKELLKDVDVYRIFGLLNPSYIKPKHQIKLVRKFKYILDSYLKGDVERLSNFRYCYSTPPRSSKTELVTTFIFMALLHRPNLKVVYLSNSDITAKDVSIKIRRLMLENGVILSPDINRAEKWSIDKVPGHYLGDEFYCGGTLSVFTPGSIKQGITADLLIVDDIYPNRESAESVVQREKVHQSFFSNCLSRLTPNAPVIVISTRYHQNDLISILNKSHAYEYDNLPALDENEESYWPEYWSKEKLLIKRKEIGEYEFQSLYQGNPQPKGSSLFGCCKYYQGAIPLGCQVSYGIDMAYSEKSKADYTVLSKLHHNRTNGLIYVESIWKFQDVESKVFPQIKSKVGNASINFRPGSYEETVTNLANKQYGLNIKSIGKATKSKYDRAKPFAANFDNVLFNINISKDIIQEIEDFSGTSADKHDDVVDSLVNAYDGLKIQFDNNSQSTYTNTMSAYKGISLRNI